MLNVVLLVVDSLRGRALDADAAERPRTPFLDRLARDTVAFTRAYASECWTLPAHCSMFTGLLPSEHGAHFRHLAYNGRQPTVAERLAAAGYRTEVITRNSIFDGTLPGITRGFQRSSAVTSARLGLNPLSLMLALSKPRFRRQILSSGFFSAAQRANRDFVTRFARATVPADREALAHTLDRMARLRRERAPYFLFANLYDVHAPYPPAEHSLFRPLRHPSSWPETARMPLVLPKLGGHAYLRRGFRLSPVSQRLLRGRYHRAIELMDDKLAAFYAAAEASGLLDDTVLIVTSDHGEAFGEHGLYLHDASVYDVHLRVPLFIRHPAAVPRRVEEVVSTRDLCGLLAAAADGTGIRDTLLDPAFRAARSIALAEHMHYPGVPDAAPRFRHDLAAAIAGDVKVIVRGDAVELYDLGRDRDEAAPEPATLEEFGARARAAGAGASAVAEAVAHLRRFRAQRAAALSLAA